MNKKNTVIIDAHAIGSQKGGNETYAYELAKSLDAADVNDMDMLFAVNSAAADYFSLNVHKVIFKQLTSFFYRIFFFAKICKSKEKNIILHSQYFFMPYKNVKNILTIHDVSWKMFNYFFTFKERMFFKLVDRCILKADIVLTGSETVKADILKYYPLIDKAKLRCVSYAGDHYSSLLADTSCKPYNVGSSYLLFVSNITPSKNLETALLLFSKLIEEKQFAEFKFLVVGKFKNLRYAKSILGLIKKLKCEGQVIFINDLKSSDISKTASLYKGASALLHFSFYEGFGFVPLEAMSLGCVPLVSANGSIPEVLGENYPLMFSLDDKKAMLKSLKQLLTDKTFKDNILTTYGKNINKYSWESTATKTCEIYREVFNR